MNSIGRISFFLLFFFSLSIISCTKGKDSEPQKDTYPIPEDKIVFDGSGVVGGKLVLPLEANPHTFNPITLSSVAEQKIMYGPLYLSLEGLNLDTMQEEMLLAKSRAISEDGLTYTYVLRKGLRWSDGQPFSIDDVLFTFQVVMDPNILTGVKDLLKHSDNSFPEVMKVDDTTIKFVLKEKNVLFNSAVGSVYIIPKHKWEKSYKEGNFMNSMLVNIDPAEMPTLGPYMFHSFEPDQRLVLIRNPYYFKFDKNGIRLPYLDKIIRIITPDFNATLVRFQNAETDMHEIRPEEFDLIKKDEKREKDPYTVYELGASYDTTHITLNQNPKKNKDGVPFVEPAKLALFTDKRFKQAISYAIDREGIVKTCFHGRATPIYSFTSPANKGWFNVNQKAYLLDLEKSKALLAEIGLKDTNNDGIVEYNDKTPVKLAIKTNSENHTRIQMGNIIKEDLKKIGIDTSMQPVPFNVLVTSLNDTFDYDAVIMGWGSGVPPDPAMSKNIILSSGRSHQWHPRQEAPHTPWEKRMDELITLNLSSLNIDERKKYWFELLDIWGEELPQIMMVSPNMFVAIKNKFGNTKPVSLRPYFDWNVEELYDKTLLPKQ